jgi:2-methylisocitrate lyase-like PEP mutase family enzyme
VIVARTAALSYGSLEAALDRIRAYAQTGAEVIRLVGLQTRAQLEAIHAATPLPLTVLSPPDDIRDDRAFLAATGVKILMLGNPVFAMAVKSIYDGLKHLKDGGAMAALSDQEASSELLQRVNRTEEILRLQQQFLRS